MKKNRSDYYLKSFVNENCPNAVKSKAGKQMLNSMKDKEIESTLNFNMKQYKILDSLQTEL